MRYWYSDHPYRWRTWIRAHLPWVLIGLGVADKGEDCEVVGGSHRWYKKDDDHSACYHCKVVRRDQLLLHDFEDESHHFNRER